MSFQTVITGFIAAVTALSSNNIPTEQNGSGYGRIQVPVLYDPNTGLLEFPVGITFQASGTWAASPYLALFDASSGGNCLLAWQIPAFTLASGATQSFPAHAFDMQLARPLPVGLSIPAGTVLGQVINAAGYALACSVVNPIAITYSGSALAATTSPLSILNSGTVVTPDGSKGSNFQVTLTQNVTIALPINVLQGQVCEMEIIQDATGTRTATWATGWLFAGASKTLTVTAAAIDVVRFINIDGTHYLAELNKAYG